MQIEQTWRWYGPHDPVTLNDIAQAGATGIVHALHDIPVGEIWPVHAIKERQQLIRSVACDDNRQLEWMVVESLNVHESIKQGLDDREEYIEKYIASLENLAACGISIVCYNFMPVLDWTRTNLAFKLADGSLALAFEMAALAAFDLYILERRDAEKDYDQSTLEAAESYFESLSESDKADLSDAILQGIPGTGESFEINAFRQRLDDYENISRTDLAANMDYFLKRVGPVADSLGVKLAVHPDDPPFPLFGLPRIVSTAADFDRIRKACNVEANGFTFCTGSLSPRVENNIPELLTNHADRVHFVHLRNVKKTGKHSFYESRHLDGVVDMYEMMNILVEEAGRRGNSTLPLPYRPDHGHQIMSDLSVDWPFHGYTAAGRLRGGAELKGIHHTLEKQQRS